MKYTSCDILPLDVFITCIVDGDYKGMGGDTDEENGSLWSDCYEEYCALINRTNSSYSMLLMVEIEKLHYRYMSIDRAIEFLYMMRDDDIVGMLHKEGVRFPFNDKDRPSYFNDLRKARKHADRILFQKRDKENMLKKISGDGGGKVTRQRFNDDIAVISKTMGFRINRKETTAAEYASYICMHVASQNTKKTKEDGGRTDNRPNR